VAGDEGGETMRTLYDGLGFEEIRAGAVFSDGSFTTRYATGLARPETKNEGMRYRWLGETAGESRSGGEAGAVAATRYTGVRAALYVRGEAVGMNMTSSAGSRGGTRYLGKDILGSVRSASGEYGTLEERYEYDAFGKPYKGDLDNGMNLGYTGKPYDAATGLYNYGYRDYRPEAARFTTVDPVRDGSNWFVYVNNDPVNWIDPWGLSASDNYNDYLYAGTAPELVFTASTVFAPQVPDTWNDYANALVIMAGSEMIGVGGIISTGGLAVISDTLAVGTVGAVIGGSITGAGFFAIGVGIIGIGIDILEGNGLDHTEKILDAIFGKE
jgi:RHS repeat-associated protein